MDGYEFEHKCAKLLRQKGYHNVTVTKGSGDQGVDIIAYKGIERYAIQCKYYSSPVGNKAIQEVYAGGKFYDCDKYIVMTNSTFTEPAKQMAKKLNVQLWARCSVSNTFIGSPNIGLREIMWVINMIAIIIGIISLVGAKHYPQAMYINYSNGVLCILAGLAGWLGWAHFIPAIISGILHLATILINMIFSLKIAMFDWRELIVMVLPAFYFIHAYHIKQQ